MKMAYILFDKMTTLDFVGFYEAVSWLRILKSNLGSLFKQRRDYR
jgi:hypothetical protein